MNWCKLDWRFAVVSWLSFVAACDGRTADLEVAYHMDRAFRISLAGDENGSEVVWDTGSELSYVTQRMVDMRGLPTRALATPIRLRDSTGGEQDILRSATCVSLSVFDGAANAQWLPILPVLGPGMRFDAILGRDVMFSFDWIVDAKAGSLIRTSRGLVLARLASEVRTVVASVPIRVDAEGVWLDVRLCDRIQVGARIDTGASRTMVPEQLVQKLQLVDGAEDERRAVEIDAALIAEGMRRAGLKVEMPTVPEGGQELVGVNGKPLATCLYVLPQLDIGGVVEKELIVAQGGGSSVVLGADVLRRWPWVMDSHGYKLLIVNRPQHVK